MKKILTFLVLFAMILVSCNRNKVYEKYHKFENLSWKRVDSSVFFNVPIKDTTRNYDITLAIRYIDGINLKNVDVGITIYMPDSSEIYNEYSVPLINIDGSYRGSVAGDIWDLYEKIIKNMPFPISGTYRFEIQNLTGYHYETRGLMEIGLIVKKTKGKKNNEKGLA